MRFMATLTFDQTRQAEITERIPAEQARVHDLFAEGALDAMHLADARDRVWLVLQADSDDAARRVLASLPLYPYAAVDLALLATMG